MISFQHSLRFALHVLNAVCGSVDSPCAASEHFLAIMKALVGITTFSKLQRSGNRQPQNRSAALTASCCVPCLLNLCSRLYSSTTSQDIQWNDPLEGDALSLDPTKLPNVSAQPQSSYGRSNMTKRNHVSSKLQSTGADAAAELLSLLSSRLAQATDAAFDQAKTLWNEYVDFQRVSPTLAHYEVMLQIYLLEGNLSSARSLIQNIRGTKLRFNHTMYNLALQVLICSLCSGWTQSVPYLSNFSLRRWRDLSRKIVVNIACKQLWIFMAGWLIPVRRWIRRRWRVSSLLNVTSAMKAPPKIC
jgi:hypothetical protein